jgi:hypothetical protein
MAVLVPNPHTIGTGVTGASCLARAEHSVPCAGGLRTALGRPSALRRRPSQISTTSESLSERRSP